MSPTEEDLQPVKNQPVEKSCANCHQFVEDDGYGELTHRFADPAKRLPFIFSYFCSTKRVQLATAR